MVIHKAQGDTLLFPGFLENTHLELSNRRDTRGEEVKGRVQTSPMFSLALLPSRYTLLHPNNNSVVVVP